MKLNQLITESVTFFIDHRDENENFKDILSMCWHLKHLTFREIEKNSPFLYKHLVKQNQSGKGVIDFDPDGDSFDRQTGVINVYPRGLITDHFAAEFMKCLNAALDKLKHKITVGKISKEGDKKEWDKPRLAHKDGDSFSSIGVIRIPVEANHSEKVPYEELNLANDNARALLRVLGVPVDEGDLGGTIKHQDIPRMIMKIRNIHEDKIKANTREPAQSHGRYVDRSGDTPEIKKGAQMYHMGLDQSRIQVYLDKLMVILKQAHDAKMDVHFG